jgi:hypothetical protein
VGSDGYRDYIPIDPLPSPTVTYNNATGTEVTAAWSTLSTADTRKLLSDIHSEISVAKIDASGNLTYLVAKAAASTGDYQVVMDYTKYRTEEIQDKTTASSLGTGRVGVGMRMKAMVHTTAANLDLGSLFQIGVAASLNKLNGSLTVDIIGIGGTDDLILTPSQIDQTSIQKSLEALAGIKARISDDNTHLDPQLLWVKPTTPIAPTEIPKKLN